MDFIIAQWIGIINMVIVLIGVQFKKVNHILISQIITNILSALCFALLGGMSGACICVIAIAQLIVMFIFNKKNRENAKQIRIRIVSVFCVLYMLGTAFFYQGWQDFFSCTCAILFALAVVQENSDKVRYYLLANSLLWVVYDIANGAYTNILLHGMSAVSILIAMYRFHRAKSVGKV